ncbi:MAG TPA: hypothetical protein VGK29_02595 [Paludibaculum sp.]|jgi:hypothetical protein
MKLDKPETPETTPETTPASAASATPTAPAPPRRTLRRRAGPEPVLDIVKGILLEEEDPADFLAHVRSLTEKIPPNCEYDQFNAQLSASNTWRARRCVIYEGGLMRAKMSDDAPQVDRVYKEIDSHCRAALTLHDPQFLNSLRYVRDLETVSLRRAALINREMRTPPKKQAA